MLKRLFLVWAAAALALCDVCPFIPTASLSFRPRTLLAAQYVARAFTPASGSSFNPTVTKIASALNVSVTAGTGYNVITSATCAQNATVIILAQRDTATSDTTYTFGDQVSNSYARPANGQAFDSSDGIGIVTAYAVMTTALPSGDTITFTPQVSDSHTDILGYCVTGVATSGPLDQSSTAVTSDGTTQTSGSITLSVTPSAAILLAGGYGAFSAYGNIFGSPATGLDHTAAANSRYAVTEWLSITSTSPGTATFTTATGQAAMVFINLKHP